MEKKNFKRGNLVKILVGHLSYEIKDGITTSKEMMTELIGKLAIIDYNCQEKFGWKENRESYAIRLIEDNSIMWKPAEDLELVEEGGEYLFKQAKDNKLALTEKRNKEWKEMREKHRLENLQQKNQP